MKSYSFRTIIEKDGKAYHGFVPALLGCHTFGKTIEETKKNLNEAIEGYLISCSKHGDPIPTDQGLESIETVSIPVLPLGGKKLYA
jgi:predicted RNase H-like HicB family nuclease